MYKSSGHREQETSAADVWLLIFRLAVATIVTVFQLAPEATRGWAAIWQEKSWPLADVISTLGIPQPQWVLASAVVLVFLAALGLAAGFVTRLSSAILLVATTLLGYRAVIDTEVAVLELAILYCSVFVFFLLRGPGRLSADRHFRNGGDA